MDDSTFAAALRDIAEVFMFEQWLRYYFLEDKNGHLFVKVPPETMKRLYEKFEHLAPLADMLNNEEITYEKSRATVCTFVGARYDGTKYAPGVIAGVLDSKTFKVEMFVFGMWMKRHQPYLDAEKLTFSDWREMYDGWNTLQPVKDYRLKLMAGTVRDKPKTNATN